MPATRKSGADATSPPTADRELVITRIFDAPRDLVYKAWTDPEHAKHWMGPHGFVAHDFRQDPRPGGKWRLCLRPADGSRDLCQGGVFREIVAPERIVYTFAWDDENGKRGHETLVTILFEEHAGKTKMTFRQSTFESVGQRDGHRGGWGQTFDRFSEFLKTIPRANAG